MLLYLFPTIQTILFVCGGNTGRSVMASWYANSHYDTLIDTFSRGSGIDPKDDANPQPHAIQLILQGKYAKFNNIKYQRATPASIQGINYANVVIAMTASHKNRLIKLIDRECLSSNLDERGLSASSRTQWDDMCNNKDALKNKIYTLIKCGTGVDGDVSDAFGQERPVYEQVLGLITSNIDKMAANYKITKKWCEILKPANQTNKNIRNEEDSKKHK